jgi:HPt (histidine-containing phosphotransfer) domain-containing protein
MNTINVTYLEEVCGGSKEIIREMVDIFLEQVPQFYSEMRNLVDDKKYHDLGLLAHKAKSSIAIMGMDYLARRLKELELIAKAGEKVEIYEEYLIEFKSETGKAVEELNAYLNNT